MSRLMKYGQLRCIDLFLLFLFIIFIFIYIFVIYSNSPQLTYFLIRALALTIRSYELGLPSIHLEVFLDLPYYFFSGTEHGVRGHVLLCVTAKFFENNIFAPKMGKMGRPKVAFFEFTWKFSH